MACGCGSKVCNCALVAGANVTITGAGSSGNPYVISSSGGGTSAPVMTTIAGINALATAAALVPGQLYKVTDWNTGAGTSLPGPNTLWVEADDASTPSKFVRVETPIGILGPSDGEFAWNFGGTTNLMTRLRDNIGNDLRDFAVGILLGQFPWGHISWSGNDILEVGAFAFTGGFAVTEAAALAGVNFSGNSFVAGGGIIDLTGVVSGNITTNQVGPAATLNITSGAGTVQAVSNELSGTSTLTVSAGGSASACRVAAGGSLDTGAFAASSVVVDGAFTVTMTAAKTNVLINANVNPPQGDRLPWGTLPRTSGANSTGVNTGTQNLRLSYFTAGVSGTTTLVRFFSGATAAGATPTLVRVGLYSIDASGNGTLIASTANDTTLLSVINTAYSKAWSASATLQVGERYAVGILVVTAATAPQMMGAACAFPLGAETFVSPPVAALLSGQAALPASFTAGSLASTANIPYFACSA